MTTIKVWISKKRTKYNTNKDTLGTKRDTHFCFFVIFFNRDTRGNLKKRISKERRPSAARASRILRYHSLFLLGSNNSNGADTLVIFYFLFCGLYFANIVIMVSILTPSAVSIMGARFRNFRLQSICIQCF